MIRSLRKKFIFLAMASLVATMALLCLAIGVGSYALVTNHSDSIIDLLSENGGEFPRPDAPPDAGTYNFQVTQESPFEIRYFVVALTARQEVQWVNMEHIAAFDRHSAVERIGDILREGQSRTIRILVSNPCEGLDPAQLPRYFDRFYRTDSSRARSTGGYGIGLSTAKAIVLRHRGRIDNRYANGVISFLITLPCS